jgi:hypothetical protein
MACNGGCVPRLVSASGVNSDWCLIPNLISVSDEHHQVIVFDRDGWHPNTISSLLGAHNTRCGN